MAQKEPAKPSKFFSKLFSSASQAAKTVATSVASSAARVLAVPAKPPPANVQQIAVVAPAPVVPVPEPRRSEEVSPMPVRVQRASSSTPSSPTKRGPGSDTDFKEAAAGGELLLRYQQAWNESHASAVASAASGAQAHAAVLAAAATTRLADKHLTALNEELERMPDILAALARTAELAGTLRQSLQACEAAMDQLAGVLVEQSLASIKTREDKRLRSYGNIRSMEAERAIQRMRAAHVRKQQQLTVQKSMEATERQRQYNELFAQQMEHFRKHRRLLVPPAEGTGEGRGGGEVAGSLMDVGPDLSHDDLFAFLEDAEQQMAAEHAAGLDSDSDSGEEGAGASGKGGAGMVLRDEEDIDSSMAAQMAAAAPDADGD